MRSLTKFVFAAVSLVGVGILAASSITVVAQNNISSGDSLKSVEATATGQLKTRNYTITIYASPDGPLYTVLDEDGNAQGIKMSETLLAQRFPTLKSILDNPANRAGLDNVEPSIAPGALPFN